MPKQKVRQMAPKPEERKTRSTGIVMPSETWLLLRRVALERSRRSVDVFRVGLVGGTCGSPQT